MLARDMNVSSLSSILDDELNACIGESSCGSRSSLHTVTRTLGASAPARCCGETLSDQTAMPQMSALMQAWSKVQISYRSFGKLANFIKRFLAGTQKKSLQHRLKHDHNVLSRV